MKRVLQAVTCFFVCSWMAGAGADNAVFGAEPAGDADAFFEKKIRPVLVDHCYKCHAADSDKEPKGGLAVDSAAGLRQGGDSGPAIDLEKPAKSLLLAALRHDGLQMPPDKRLPDEVIEDFEQWIRLGAPDPRTGGPAVKPKVDLQAARDFWAFQPPKRTAPPPVTRADWPRRPLDHYILAKLEAAGLAPVADADRRTLARRLAFDLTGLPPTPEQLTEFLNDTSAEAVEHLVDRLLDSPHFGERWGRHWLDVARYAESNGNVDNVIYGHAWRYRDYVIRSFNADKPYDQFVIEQLAGDLLPADSPARRNELLTATGFLAIGSKPRPQNNPDFAMDVVAEQLEVTTTGLLALTVACARCHDHKFDPIPTAEYYAMAGIFTSTRTLYGTYGKGGNRQSGDAGLHELATIADDAGVRPDHTALLAEVRAEREKAAAELKRLERTVGDKPNNKNKKKKNKQPNDAAAQPQNSAEARPAALRRIELLKRQIADADRMIEKLGGEKPQATTAARAMGVEDGKPGDCEICLRGDSRSRGDRVPRGVVAVASLGAPPVIPAGQSGRLELARWIASTDNPLAARVLVNRVWRQLIGRGIVATVDNFGALGEPPTHPELLDALALQFVQEGWSIKRLIRDIVLSRTYQLSSEHQAAAFGQDPDNRLHWRHSPRRLDAESLRDAMLTVSGELDPRPLVGSAVEAYGGQDLRNSKLDLKQLIEAKGPHRSVYLPVLRNRMPEALELFDVADPSLVIGSRDATNVPSQGLYLLNSPDVVRRATRFAERLLETSDADDSARIARAFELAFGRPATEDELRRSSEFLGRARAAYAAANDKPSGADRPAWTALCQALFASAEFRYLE